MLERAQLRMLPIVNRTADHAHLVPACCNICRTCTTTNIVALVFGGIAAAGIAVAGLAKRAARATTQFAGRREPPDGT
jgi:hypothetical protein